MKQLFLILFFLSALAATAAERVTALVTITDGTTNGQTFTVNANARTWTNTVYLPSSQVLTNSDANGAKTNLFNQVGLNPFASVTLVDNETNAFKLIGASGLTLTVTPSAGYATVSYSTQQVANLIGVRVPISGEPSGAQQTNIASSLVLGIGALSTNAFYESQAAVANLLGKTNDQDIAGIKRFTNVAGIWGGHVSNSPAIGGTVTLLTNGSWRTGILISPTMTNAVNYGNPFRSPGSGTSSEQFGLSASSSGNGSSAFGTAANASGSGSTALGSVTVASGVSSVALGSASIANATNATALGQGALATNVNSTAVGNDAATTAADQVRLGTASSYVSIPGGLYVEGSTTNITAAGTNNFPAGSDVAFGRYALTTLANGINDDIVIGTNVNIYVSGPSADFSIRGMAGGRDGKIVIIENDTGYNMTIAVEGGALGNGPTAGNRITSNTGADRATTGNGTAILKYNATTSRWKLISFDP